MAQPVLSEEALKAALIARGCVETRTRTGTGIIWKTKQGLHFMVPFSEQGYYPDWMLYDLEDVVGKIDAWSAFNKRQ